MVDGKITQSSSKTGKGSWRLIDLYLIKIEQRLGLYIFKYLISSMLLTHIVHWDQYLVAEMDFVVDDMFLYMNPRVTCYSLTLYNLKSIVAGTSKNTDISILTSLLGLIRIWMSTLIGMQPEFYRNGVWYESHLWHSTGNGREEELGLFQFQCSSVFSFFHFDSLKSQLFNKNNNNTTILILLLMD